MCIYVYTESIALPFFAINGNGIHRLIIVATRNYHNIILYRHIEFLLSFGGRYFAVLLFDIYEHDKKPYKLCIISFLFYQNHRISAPNHIHVGVYTSVILVLRGPVDPI